MNTKYRFFDRLIDDQQLLGGGNENIKPKYMKCIKNDENFIRHAKNNQWKNRRDPRNQLCWSWRADVFEFILEVYRPWVGNGLVQSDIKAVDPELWWALRNKLRKGVEMPPELDLPTEVEANLRKIEDPADREMLLVAREWDRRRKAKDRLRPSLE